MTVKRMFAWLVAIELSFDGGNQLNAPFTREKQAIEKVQVQLLLSETNSLITLLCQ